MEEVKAKRPRGRPRKRPRPEDENAASDTKSDSNKRRGVVVVETKPIALVGRYVLKEFESEIYLGKIVYYDSGLYRVDYEDGDCEDLDSSELRQFLLGENDFKKDLSRRRKKLDEWLLKKSKKNEKDGLEKKDGDLKSEVDRVEVSTLSEFSVGLTVENDSEGVEGDVDSSSDSCEHTRETDTGLEAKAPLVPPPQLPPSSRTIGVPEEYVSHLFSVYGFLRSFGIHLFLSPFGLDDFVGSLNCCVPNTLMDAIHVALFRTLRRHLETLSLDGSELASNCLRCIDWSLLDTLTWPIFVVQYLTSMGYIKGPEWKELYDDVLEREYWSLSSGKKVKILQILCDDVLESGELRAEIDIREESEVGIDPDGAASDAQSEPRRVHPRYSNTSACKDREAVEVIAENDVLKSSYKAKPLGFRGTQREIDAPGADVDGNGDECRICGMDGILLCCDGCPSAYHTRCIGVAKMYIPEGSWYCPECTVNKMGPTITRGTSLRGAQLFGIDLYEQVFLGTCDHLLVLNAFNNKEPYIRYYNPVDIPKALRTLLSSVQHVSLYSEICKEILQFWGIPESVISPVGIIEMGTNVTNNKTDEKFCGQSLHLPVKESPSITDMVDAENGSCNNESNVDNLTVSCLYKSMDTATRTDFPIAQNNAITVTEKSQNCVVLNRKLPGPIKMESAASTGSISQQADPSDVTYQSLVERSSAIDLLTCTSRISIDGYSGHASSCLSANMSFQSKGGNHEGLSRVRKSSPDNCVFMGSLFKPHAYINQYTHGEFAAAAAAKLAVLSSEESQFLEAHKSSNARKVISSSISLQAKAFSSTASRFFWPCSERKLWEVPRERCSWCYSCKAPPSNRRGCMLNAAITVATKSAMKFLNGLHPPKIGEGNLPTIATYILYMEESLCGLIGGPFVSASYRNKWRKQVEEASTFNSIKALLLELAENICHIALSGDWAKSMDDRLGDSVIQSASLNVVTTQKCGFSGKRGRKRSGISEVTADGYSDQGFSWWQGGNSSKLIFEKAILPRRVVRNVACQGGVRRISGLNYADGSEIPKRSRRMVWRAIVEKIKTASELALQVRYLDLHVRWSELVRPELSVQDGKGPETEASAFRNAIIHNKRIVENKIRYGVVFGNQKHLPSRVMKNVIDIEQSQDGKEKYWFREACIPLYLIKEYEESVHNMIVPSSKKPSNELSAFQKKQLKASRKDLFSYLVCRRDKMEKCACASCQLDVLLGIAVKCSACLGFCHNVCTSSSMYMKNGVEPFIICKRCNHSRSLAPSEIKSESPTSPLLSHQQEYHTAVKVNKATRPIGFNQPLASVRTQESCSEIKQSTSDSSLVTKTRSRTLSWGIIWKKKNSEDSGDDFRRANILLRGNSDIHHLEPVCDLCQQPYNCDLMYIHCETCERWFHAEAVELVESKLCDVVGFKCCKCRRIGGPECPYMDPELKEQRRKKRRLRAQKQGQGSIRVDSDGGTTFESKDFKSTTPIYAMEEMFVPEDDPLLFSLSTVELITEKNSEVDCGWNTSVPGPQKLPVRRHVKCEGDAGGGSIGNNLPNVDVSTTFEPNSVMDHKEELSVPCAEWDASGNGLEGEMIFDYDGYNYEDMEFEPQTYFSFSELLATDEGGQLDGVDASGIALGSQEDFSCSAVHDEAPQQCDMGASNHQQECTIATVNKTHCRICPDMEPAPDLSCTICGFSIHSYCSPWDESSHVESCWKCGNCREWR